MHYVMWLTKTYTTLFCVSSNLTILNQQDILICLLTLYQAPAKVIADKINRSVSSIPKLKSITAKTIGTTTPQLREFLISFMAK